MRTFYNDDHRSTSVSNDVKPCTQDSPPFAHFNHQRHLLKHNVSELPSRYELKELIGRGAYGSVFTCRDTQTDTFVAVKKISNVFQKEFDFQKRIYREVKILKHIQNKHSNVINLIDLLKPSSYEDFQSIYIVTELVDDNLHDVLRDQRYRYSTDQQINYFLHQLLSAVKFLHDADIVHRDIKPSNILLCETGTVKLCDFGLSRESFKFTRRNSTTNVVTKPYRAPELLLDYELYSKPVDMWSVGCVFAELLSNESGLLFGRPKNDHAHLNAIVDLCGTPNHDEIKGVCGGVKYIRSLDMRDKADLRDVFPNASDCALDLLAGLLMFDPDQRITVDEALNHPYFDMFDKEEPTKCNKFQCDDMLYNRAPGDGSDLDWMKRMIYDEVVGYDSNNGDVSPVSPPSCVKNVDAPSPLQLFPRHW